MSNLIRDFRRSKDKQYLEEFYNRPDYLKIYDKPKPKWLLKFKILVSLMKLVPNDRVLDVGCASQQLRPFIEGQNANYTGLDISRGFKPDILADAEDLSVISDSSFDWVVMSDVLEHLPNPHKAIMEAGRVGRNVLAVVPNLYEFNSITFIPQNPNDRHISRYTPWGWMTLFQQAGLDITHTQGFFYCLNVKIYTGPLQPILKRPLVYLHRFLSMRPFLDISNIIDMKLSHKRAIKYLEQEFIIVAST